MDYQTFTDFIVKIIPISTIKILGPFALAFFIGFVMGLFDFARNFSNSIKSIIFSFPGFAYCFINGFAIVLALSIVNKLNIQILSFNFSDNNYMVASLVGVVGYITIFTKIANNNKDDKEITGIIVKALSQIQKIFFDRYTLMREVELRPQLTEIMESVDSNLIIMISDCCTGIARNLNENRGAALAERLLKIHSSTMPIQIKKIEIGLEHVKNIGIQYFEQVVKDFESSRLEISIQDVDNKINELQKISEEEKQDG